VILGLGIADPTFECGKESTESSNDSVAIRLGMVMVCLGSCKKGMLATIPEGVVVGWGDRRRASEASGVL